MNVKMKSTGKVHEVSTWLEGTPTIWLLCTLGFTENDVTVTTEPVTCKSCLKMALGKAHRKVK